jgi:hypothetical protein
LEIEELPTERMALEGGGIELVVLLKIFNLIKKWWGLQ